MDDVKTLKVLNSSGDYDEYDLSPKGYINERVVYYVDINNGSNDNDGLTADTAFKTLDYAVSKAPVTDLYSGEYSLTYIYVAYGTYTDPLVIKEGQAISFYGIPDSSGTYPNITIGSTSNTSYPAVRVYYGGRAQFYNINQLTLYGQYGFYVVGAGSYLVLNSSVTTVKVHPVGTNNIGIRAAGGGMIYSNVPNYNFVWSACTSTSTNVALFMADDPNSYLHLINTTSMACTANSTIVSVCNVQIQEGARGCVYGCTIVALSCATSYQRGLLARGGIIHSYNNTNNATTPKYADRGGYIYEGSQSSY